MKKIVSRHQNNFALIRWVGAILVFVGHMGYITQTEIPTYLGFQYQAIGVKILFFLGGYFIAQSWMQDPNPVRYAIKRITRLLPPFIVFILFATFVAGPMLSSYTTKEYFSNPLTYYYLKNLRFFIVYGLPGVFEENLYPYAVNGSLWTMPVEAFLYLVVPVLLTILRIKKDDTLSIIRIGISTVLIVSIYLYLMSINSQMSVVVYGTPLIQALQLATYYAVGVFCSTIRVSSLFKPEIACTLIILLPAFHIHNSIVQEIILYLLLPYGVLSIGYSKTIIAPRFFNKCECTYSFYLYGFFIQQVVVNIMLKLKDSNFVQTNYLIGFIISFVITVAISMISYYRLEQPSIRIGKRICQYIYKDV